MNPKVSIIIPVHNGGKTMQECLSSVLSQSPGEIEVICINDGSTDGTAEILREAARSDKRVRVFHFQENKGIVSALKTGLLEASGDYVMFADSDDILLPGACENAVRLIEEYDVDILQFSISVKHVKGHNIDGFLKELHCRPMESTGAKILYDCFSMRRFPHNVYTKIYRRSICREAAENMPDIKLSSFSDLYVTFFLLYYAKTFRSVQDGPYYEYRFLGTGVSTQAPDASQFAMLCEASGILPRIEEFLRDRHEYAARRELVEAIGIILRVDVVNKLLSMPEITKETIRLLVEHWGCEAVYDFIHETGLLDVPCGSRHHMVTDLAAANRKLAGLNTNITVVKKDET